MSKQFKSISTESGAHTKKETGGLQGWLSPVVDRSELAHVGSDVHLYPLFETVCHTQLCQTLPLHLLLRQPVCQLGEMGVIEN